MSNDLNELKIKVAKNDIISGLFIGLIILFAFSLSHAMVYLLGVIIAILNFWMQIYSNKKWFLNNNFLLIFSTFCRIMLVAIVIIPFIGDITLVVTYAAGFILHYINLGYCIISKKGSA